MEATPIQAWECAACGEIYILDLDAAEECCSEIDTQEDVYPPPSLRLVK